MDKVLAYTLTINDNEYNRVYAAAHRRGIGVTEYLERALHFGVRCLTVAEAPNTKLIIEENNKQREVVE